jgi:hypothetical protein
MVPITLSTEELSQVLRLVTVTDREYGPSRICRYLAANHSARTRSVNVECSVGNISDLVSKMINPRIQSVGLMVGCTRPFTPFKNRYGHHTGENLWSFYRAAANDPDYDNLDADLDDLADQHPELLTDGPGDDYAADAWEHDLSGSEK